MRMFRHSWTVGHIVIAIAVLSLSFCSKDGSNTEQTGATQKAEQASEAKEPSAQARAEADEIYNTRCVPCHGSVGKGDGAASKGLTPPPRDYTDPAWQDAVTDEHIEKIVVYGGAAVGKSAAMPPNPDLASKPDVVNALREKIRSFRGK